MISVCQLAVVTASDSLSAEGSVRLVKVLPGKCVLALCVSLGKCAVCWQLLPLRQMSLHAFCSRVGPALQLLVILADWEEKELCVLFLLLMPCFMQIAGSDLSEFSACFAVNVL